MYGNRTLFNCHAGLSVGCNDKGQMMTTTAIIKWLHSPRLYTRDWRNAEAFEPGTLTDDYLREAIDAMHNKPSIDNTGRGFRRF